MQIFIKKNMVEKKVKKIDPEYYTVQAIEKKFKPLFNSAKTSKSKEIIIAKDYRKTIEKKEKNKLSFTQFDAPKGEY